jgi:hypothetical protein
MVVGFENWMNIPRGNGMIKSRYYGIKGWGCSSMVECLPHMCKVLVLSPMIYILELKYIDYFRNYRYRCFCSNMS